ncbi:inositol phosphorylceramide glucuronosyltransferase 1-like isoform X2 [Macadamia integrifolia]|uniref:inositol phosphorylceramide glucuronosyltransferase 1-like isoform X2 n=1 Tax=Macadamia integrifolia TaxID=60698 RepID=UPI001C4E7637|nr:inositol phosphorylceramide glucuronosyltransferase 1-like isoform X2 [Macadamia integrifolia]
MRLRFSDFVFLVILLFSILSGITDRVSGSKSEAYVTLLYGDEFLLGVRVLGKSIRNTGSTKDMVVLVSDGVSDYAKKLLETISLLANPNQVRPKRFWGVYTKLKIFNLTDYKKVVYLDADTIVVKSIEDLFKCNKFCANLKHSERLNSGVMVVEPSETVFNDMMSKVSTLHSYTGGDQGFLNSYFPEFANAHVFEPNLSSDVMNSRPVEMERLSTLYNADVGLYMLANKWMVDDETELRVVHYTLGPLKPWDWWTAWLLKPVDLWQNVRVQLEESLPGTGGGSNPKDNILVKFIFLLPLFLLLFFYYRSFLQTQKDFFGVPCRSSLCDRLRQLYYRFRAGGGLPYSTVGVSSSSIIDSNQKFSNGIQSKVPPYLVGASVFICFISAVVSLALALAVVPRQVMPWTGLLLLYEWTFIIFFILFGSYLHLIYRWGKMTAAQAGSYPAHSESSDYDYGKGHQRQASTCDVATWYYGLGMALLAVAAPSLPCLLGITALFARLGLMVVGGIVLASFMTYASERLAIRAFLRGLEDRDMPRTRNSCLC